VPEFTIGDGCLTIIQFWSACLDCQLAFADIGVTLLEVKLSAFDPGRVLATLTPKLTRLCVRLFALDAGGCGRFISDRTLTLGASSGWTPGRGHPAVRRSRLTGRPDVLQQHACLGREDTMLGRENSMSLALDIAVAAKAIQTLQAVAAAVATPAALGELADLIAAAWWLRSCDALV
jgi:hypothetical protein